MAGKKGMMHYSRELKEQAVRMHVEQGMTYPAISQALGLRDPNRAKVWVRAYRREGWVAFTKPQGRPRAENREQAELARLRMENALLKKFHSELRKALLAQYRVIYHCRKEYSVKAMCTCFGVSRAAYYAWVKRMDQADPDQTRMDWVQEAYAASHQTYGYRRIRLWLAQKRHLRLNHKTILRLMHKMGLRSIARQRRPYQRRTTVETEHRYPNRLKRDFVATQPNQKWVTDITFVHTQQGWAYLSTIKDLYDGFIVAHQLGSQNSVDLVQRTLRQAWQTAACPTGVLLHSDQGHQYRGQAYHVLVQQMKLVPSMSRRGNCWDNAPMENFFSHLKEEALRHCQNPTVAEVRQVIEEYIHFYNYERIQLKTKLTPYERRCQSM
jgi:putative transposase